jgi:hypothetical protein
VTSTKNIRLWAAATTTAIATMIPHVGIGKFQWMPRTALNASVTYGKLTIGILLDYRRQKAYDAIIGYR